VLTEIVAARFSIVSILLCEIEFLHRSHHLFGLGMAALLKIEPLRISKSLPLFPDRLCRRPCRGGVVPTRFGLAYDDVGEEEIDIGLGVWLEFGGTCGGETSGWWFTWIWQNWWIRDIGWWTFGFGRIGRFRESVGVSRVWVVGHG
jgi:hypothetical protein